MIIILTCSTTVFAATQERVTVSGYLPPLKSYGGDHGPNYVICQELWVQMTSEQKDGFYAAVWYCRSVDHSCFQVRGTTAGYGCSGGGVEGWSWAEVIGSDRDAIIKNVVDPCFTAVAKETDIPGMTAAEVVALMKSLNERRSVGGLARPRPVRSMCQGAIREV